jgi:hypothetical protein
MKVGIAAEAMGSQRGGEESYIWNVIHALATMDQDVGSTLFFGQALYAAWSRCKRLQMQVR